MAAAVITKNHYNLLPGRLRIPIKGLLRNPTYAQYLTEGLLSERAIWSVTVNPITGKALIYFDPKWIGLSEIQLLITAIGQTYHMHKSNIHTSLKTNWNLTHALAKSPAKYALATSFVLVGLIIKRLFVGRSLLSGSPQIFNFAALATLVAGYPLLRNNFETMAKKNNINYELMLFLPTLLLLALRESIIGLSALWLVQLTYWLGIETQEDSHKRIYHMLLKKQQQALTETLVEKNHSLTHENKNFSVDSEMVLENPLSGEIQNSSSLPEKLMWLSLTISAVTFFLTRDFRRSLAILLAGCPAAISLSRNAALHTAVGKAAEKGIFIKETETLERIGEIHTVLFDKTGTLTTSYPMITNIIPLTPKYNENEILVLAASTDKTVNHPLADMLVCEVRKRDLILLPAHQESVLSFGVQATIKDQNITVGNRLFMQRKKVPVAKAKAMVLSLEHLEMSVLYVAANKQLIGLIGIKDHIKPESYAGINQLRSLGIQDIRVITGDSASAAKNITTELGLRDSWHSMLPEDKVRIIKDLQSTGKKIAMIGDGTNDSLAFTASDISVAMGMVGTVQAIDNADIVIANDDPQKVAEIIQLSRFTNKVIQQNAALSTASNLVGIALAATALITPVTAGLLLNISTLALIMNSKCLLSPQKH